MVATGRHAHIQLVHTARRVNCQSSSQGLKGCPWDLRHKSAWFVVQAAGPMQQGPHPCAPPPPTTHAHVPHAHTPPHSNSSAVRQSSDHKPPPPPPECTMQSSRQYGTRPSSQLPAKIQAVLARSRNDKRQGAALCSPQSSSPRFRRVSRSPTHASPPTPGCRRGTPDAASFLRAILHFFCLPPPLPLPCRARPACG